MGAPRRSELAITLPTEKRAAGSIRRSTPSDISRRRQLPSGSVEVAIVGGGLAGLATAARIQSKGLSTVVLEAHSLPGGCAGYFRRNGFSFDVGATTLVDFVPGGVGGELLDDIGMTAPEIELLAGYRAWLPDRTVDLHRDQQLWHAERLAKLGDSNRHQRFWHLLDTLADVFWAASRSGIKLPIQRPGDAVRAARVLPFRHWPLARHLGRTMGDALRSEGLREDKALVGLLSMLIEDTVHATVDDAPLINAALGITIRGAGLSRARGGMCGFIEPLAKHYKELGGEFVRNCVVDQVSSEGSRFRLCTSKGELLASQVVSAIPAQNTASIGPEPVSKKLTRFLQRDADSLGGAMVLFLGVEESDVAGQDLTHHQILDDYNRPLGNGNNMFISVSSSGDVASAPRGHRSVMISTHCELDRWMNLDSQSYGRAKDDTTEHLLTLARRVYPDLAHNPLVCELATPRTYARFARRPNGAVGGVRQRLGNTNLFAIPHDIGVDGFHLVGDSTWPGLGTVASALGSRLVAANVLATSKVAR